MCKKSISVLTIVMIILACSTGCQPSMINVPYVVGMTQSEAESAITGAGLALGTVTEQYSYSVPVGQVISQDPAAGGSVTSGSSVDLVVSKGPEKAQFTPGISEMSTPVTVDAYGLILQGEEGTPIEDIMVEIPAGAIQKSTDVSIGYNDGTLSVVSGEPSGVVLVVDTGDLEKLDNPMTVTFKFAESGTKSATDYIPVPYRIDENGELHLVTLISVDEETGTAQFVASRGSSFTWVLVPLNDESTETKALPTKSSLSLDTGFRPNPDGFERANLGSQYYTDGECAGMTAWTQWYFDTHRSDGTFYGRFDRTTEETISTQAFHATGAGSPALPTVGGRLIFDRINFAIAKNALDQTKKPVLLDLFSIDWVLDWDPAIVYAHSVLAYGYDETSSYDVLQTTDFYIYDPNYPGNDSKKIRYLHDSHKWEPYGSHSYDHIASYGEQLDQEFQAIYESLELESTIVIVVDSHQNDGIVDSYSTIIYGIIENTANPNADTRLVVVVDGVEFNANVDGDGNFDVEIPIHSGPNDISFITRVYDEVGNYDIVRNNMWDEEFVLNGSMDEAAILVTLTWDKNDTDVDLYVIDPSGDYSCYYNMDTEDGGELDVDDVDGFGPEHWTLTYDDIVRWDQDYTVRVHYYSDHGNGPTNYKVTILLNEGSEWQTTQQFSGTLVTCSRDNDGPSDTGADWNDIAVIGPVHTAEGKTIISAVTPLENIPVINMPVPLPEERALLK